MTDKTWYVRDAAGNVLAVYGNMNGGSEVYRKGQYLYGSSRLGIWERGSVVGDSIWDKVGVKRYELVNHLGNLSVTLSDKAVLEGDHYVAEMLSAGDYYPFGMGMMDRKYAMVGYRYGFNGKENDNEVKGEGNEQDYGMRVYDGRVGRFLSVDPLTREYPWYTPYQFSGNTPIQATDLDGAETFLEQFHFSKRQYAEFQIARAKWLAEEEQKRRNIVLMADIYGNGHIGPEAVVKDQLAYIKDEHDEAVASSIKGGLGGSLGYLVNGEKGHLSELVLMVLRCLFRVFLQTDLMFFHPT